MIDSLDHLTIIEVLKLLDEANLLIEGLVLALVGQVCWLIRKQGKELAVLTCFLKHIKTASTDRYLGADQMNEPDNVFE